jgi:LuxR family maltose regulon positive regulatory protein
MGLDLSAGEVAELEERTEGWIAALQLAALSVRDREDISGFVSPFAGTDRDVFDYLAEEVLDRQAEETQTFLLRTSILDRMSGALCAAVTDQEGAQRTLENLERANLLMVPLDDRRRWYRYHHLFSGFLRERLRRENPEIVSRLHRRASVWHESNGTMSEAVGHALAAGDFGRAGVMIEGLMDSTTARGEVPALEVMIKSLPEEVLRSTPNLCNMYAISVLMPAGRWDAAEAWLQAAEKMLHVDSEDSAQAQTLTPAEAFESRDEQLAMVVGARAIIAMSRGDIQCSISLNRRTLELFPDEKRTPVLGVPANNLSEYLLDIGDLAAARAAIGEAAGIGRAADAPAITAWSLCHLGRLETTEGRLSEATKAYEWVLRLADELGEGAVLMEAGAARVRMGELLLERNDPEAATRSLQEGIELLLEWSKLGSRPSLLLEDAETRVRPETPVEVQADAAQDVANSYITLSRVNHARGDTHGVHEALQKADHVMQGSPESSFWKNRTKTRTEAWRARFWISAVNLRASTRWALDRGLSATDDLTYSPEAELEYVTLARLLIARGDHEEATGLLERLMEAAEAGGRGRTVIELLVLKALVLRARNDEPGALKTLHSALILAEPETYIRTFTDEGEPMADLLRRLLKAWRRERSDDVPLEYVGKLVEALGAGVTAPAGTDVPDAAGLALDPITGRELEVLRLLDSDLANREIAARLFVSLDTVKSHTKHIYVKLGVHNRHQAVARAKDLKVL